MRQLKLFCILLDKKDTKYDYNGKRIYFPASSRKEAEVKGNSFAKEAGRDGGLLIQVI